VKPHRKYIREGPLIHNKVNNSVGEERYFYLFNDILLCTKQLGNRLEVEDVRSLTNSSMNINVPNNGWYPTFPLNQTWFWFRFRFWFSYSSLSQKVTERNHPHPHPHSLPFSHSLSLSLALSAFNYKWSIIDGADIAYFGANTDEIAKSWIAELEVTIQAAREAFHEDEDIVKKSTSSSKNLAGSSDGKGSSKSQLLNLFGSRRDSVAGSGSALKPSRIIKVCSS
jgi:hypothetical protein